MRLVSDQPREGRKMDGNQILRHGIVLSGAPRQCLQARKNLSIDSGDGLFDGELDDFRVIGDKGREGIGVGDVKLLLMLAVWIGFSHTLLALMVGILLGFAAAIVMLFRRSSRKTLESWAAARLPFGTFICIGGIVSALWGSDILRAYLSLAGF